MNPGVSQTKTGYSSSCVPFPIPEGQWLHSEKAVMTRENWEGRGLENAELVCVCPSILEARCWLVEVNTVCLSWDSTCLCVSALQSTFGFHRFPFSGNQSDKASSFTGY